MMNEFTDKMAFYEVFRDISVLVHSRKSIREIMDLVVLKATEILKAKGALFRLHDLDTKRFEVTVAYGMGNRYLSKGPVSSEKIIEDLKWHYDILIIDDIWNAPRVEYPQQAWDEGIRMMLDVPLVYGDEILGVLRIYLAEKRSFSEEEIKFLTSIAEQCACAINKIRVIENQQEKYEQLAIRTEKLSALGRLAAGIAHEINNPLAGILLFSTNMKKKAGEDSPFSEGLDVIVSETIRCRGIIQELLEFSREREPQKSLNNVNKVLDKSLNILENEFRLNRISVKKDLMTDMPDMLLDGNQVQQVFVNVLINAVHAVEEHGEITIKSRVDTEEGTVAVDIADNGCGISPENRSRIFEPFFSTKAKGTGLGLAVSYGIVKNHKGDIRVSSESGQGTRFTITFPLAANGDVVSG
ncbi:MAG: GAF domain-containing protein [Deltaproteobacteria bacterium]|nr:GAF domain-containing protein [Deltaproteobacteria bacterium]